MSEEANVTKGADDSAVFVLVQRVVERALVEHGVTLREASACAGVVASIADAIAELREVPSGHLYARLMEHMSLSAYTTAIDTLVVMGLVRKSGHLLTWMGDAT